MTGGQAFGPEEEQAPTTTPQDSSAFLNNPHTNPIHQASQEQARTEAPRIFEQAMAETNAVREIPEETRDFLTMGPRRNELFEMALRNDRHGFEALIGDRLDQDQMDVLYRSLQRQVNQNFQERLSRALQHAETEEERNAYSSALHIIVQDLAENGDVDAERRAVKDATDELSPEQRTGIMGSLLRAGFSSSAIFETEHNYQMMERPSEEDTKQSAFIMALQIIEQIINLLVELIRRYQNATNPQEREDTEHELDTAERRLARLVGPEAARMTREMLLERDSGETDSTGLTTVQRIIQMLRQELQQIQDQAAATGELHSGHLRDVTPRISE